MNNMKLSRPNTNETFSDSLTENFRMDHKLGNCPLRVKDRHEHIDIVLDNKMHMLLKLHNNLVNDLLCSPGLDSYRETSLFWGH